MSDFQRTIFKIYQDNLKRHIENNHRKCKTLDCGKCNWCMSEERIIEHRSRVDAAVKAGTCEAPMHQRDPNEGGPKCLELECLQVVYCRSLCKLHYNRLMLEFRNKKAQ